MDAALAELAAAADGNGPALPTAAELRLACMVKLTHRGPDDPDGTPLADYCRATQKLLELKPDWPYAIARAADAERLRGRWDCYLPLLQRACEAACEQNDDRRISEIGFLLAGQVTSGANWPWKGWRCKAATLAHPHCWLR